MKYLIYILFSWLLFIRFLFYDEYHIESNFIAVITSIILLRIKNTWIAKAALFISFTYVLSSIFRISFNINIADVMGVASVLFIGILLNKTYLPRWN